MGATNIQWTHVPGYRGWTWNPTTGCTRVSPGCDHCYAFTLHDQRYVARREGKKVSGAQYDVPFSQVQLLEDRLTEPLRWRTPRAVFVDSMSDLFHDDVPDAYLDRVFAVMALASRHIFMVLTKRPERMREYLTRLQQAVTLYIDRMTGDHPELYEPLAELASRQACWPLSNVWLGVSTEDQERADERIPLLLQTPAAVRFISAEPLLGPIALRGQWFAWMAGERGYTKLDWVIVGGESGPGARPMDLAWARSLRDQCYRTPFFMKQLGRHPYSPRDGQPRLRSQHGSDPAEWPEDLRVREWPVA